MSTEDYKNIVRRYYEKVVNTENIDKIEAFISEEYAKIFDDKRYSIGFEGSKAHIIGTRQTYPDIHLAIERQIAEDGRMITCITALGTHQGSWLGIKPTGKLVVFIGVNVDWVVGGRIIEHGGAAIMIEPLLEIGAVKVVGPGE